ncbi:unnamed protein product [Bathycoccus prasinos]
MRDPKRQTKCARMAAAKSTLFSFLSLSFFLFSSGGVEASVSSDAATTIEMHGSGTTNPSKYFWKAMDILEERAGKPVRMTYRAVGSGTGQTEFIGDFSDFGSADIPLSSTQHSGFAGTVVQVPFQLGAVSFFHNVAADDLGVAGRLNLTNCTLAKIFRRDITTWDDATIVAENPNLSVPAGQPITIIHRSDGSSSTYGITSYFLFPTHANAKPHQGSGNVANAIAEHQYSIGYIDAGHGHELGFQEVSLTNKFGQQLVSKEANIPKAATEYGKLYGSLPSIEDDWSTVSLINLDGEDVWPITAFTYIYARTTLTGEVGRLVKSFMMYCLSDEGQAMVPDFLFYALDGTTTASMRTQVESKIALTTWTFELASTTNATVGMGANVFSAKRKSYGDYERELLVSKVDVLESSVANLQSMESIPVHGSGTTNPSKFFWKLMDTLEEPLENPLVHVLPLRTGIKEFVGADNGYEPYSHFGSGDIVVPTADYTDLNNAGKSFVTIPFQLGAISFFHNVPGVPDGKALDLQPCVLAKIFTRKIKTWDHADILSSNPGFSPPAGKEITVVRRIYGSSSTSLISQYLHKVCPSDWDIGVGSGNAASSNPTVPTKAPFWPSDTVGAEGSGGVSDAISATEYSIGYIESGHGQALGLAEVALQNKDGNYLTAADADIGSAVMQIMSSIPNADGDWDNDNLSLLDLGGEKTWPITAFSFMFIRKDLTSLGRSGPAVKAFAEMVLSPEGQAMLPDFGANAVPASIIAKGDAGLAQLKFAATSTMFIHELSTLAGTGMGTHVLSVKRKRWADVEREQLVADFEKLKADYEATIAALKSEDANTITKDELERLAVPALVFAVIAFLMICTSLILGGVSCTRTRRHERFFNEDDTLREKYATSSKA